MIFLILILIIAVDTVVFKVLVDKMAGDLDIDKPDYLESLKHVSIANVVGTILRMAGIRMPFHYAYFYHVFFNQYGLNSAAVIICLVVMGVIELAVVGGLLAVVAR